MEDHVNCVASAELQTIIPLQSFALDSLTVDEGSVLAALILHIKLPIVRHDQRMVARHAGIGDCQILLHLAANGERSVIEIEGALLAALNKDQARKDTRSDPGD